MWKKEKKRRSENIVTVVRLCWDGVVGRAIINVLVKWIFIVYDVYFYRYDSDDAVRFSSSTSSFYIFFFRLSFSVFFLFFVSRSLVHSRTHSFRTVHSFNFTCLTFGSLLSFLFASFRSQFILFILSESTNEMVGSFSLYSHFGFYVRETYHR